MMDINKKKLIILSVFFGLLIIFYFILSMKNIDNNQIQINNFDDFNKTIPQDKRQKINQKLYEIIKSSSNNKNIKSAMIRKNSYTEKYIVGDNFFSSTFIVDIASAKQSYEISFLWSTNPDTILKGDQLTFSCLDSEKLIYGDFNCREILKLPEEVEDPITQYLPHSTFNYKITLNPNKSDKIGLNIRIFIYSSDTRNTTREKAIEVYKKAATDWIKSKGLNIDDYSINYIIY